MKIASLIVALAFAGSVHASDKVEQNPPPAGGGAEVSNPAPEAPHKGAAMKHKKKKGEAKKGATK